MVGWSRAGPRRRSAADAWNGETDSVTTTPPISSATPRPMIVTIGTAALGNAWRTSTCSGVRFARIGGADVVLAQHLEHAGARHTRDQRDIDNRKRQRRQGDRRRKGSAPLAMRL